MSRDSASGEKSENRNQRLLAMTLALLAVLATAIAWSGVSLKDLLGWIF